MNQILKKLTYAPEVMKEIIHKESADFTSLYLIRGQLNIQRIVMELLIKQHSENKNYDDLLEVAIQTHKVITSTIDDALSRSIGSKPNVQENLHVLKGFQITVQKLLTVFIKKNKR